MVDNETPDTDEGYSIGGLMLGADAGGGIVGPPGSEDWLWKISYWPVSWTLRDPQSDDQFVITDPQVVP